MLKQSTYIRTTAILILLTSLASCGSKSDNKEEKKAQATLISVATAEAMSLEVREEAIGTLEGLMDPTVAAEASGRVLKVFVHPGNVVKKGQALVLIDATDYNLQRNEAQSEVARLEALVANQGRIVERNQTLVTKKFI
nr:biotin/lipoyl-binding protein [Candidatus Methylopumilus sp.]